MSTQQFIKKIQDIMRLDAGVSGDAQRLEQITWILFFKIFNVRLNDWELEDDQNFELIPSIFKWDNWAKNTKSNDLLTGDELIDFVNIFFKYFRLEKVEWNGKTYQLEITNETPFKKRILHYVMSGTSNYIKKGSILRSVLNEIDKLNFENYTDRHAFGEIYEQMLKDLNGQKNSGEFYTPRALTDLIVELTNPKLGQTVADFACGTGGFLTSTLKHLEKQSDQINFSEFYNKSIYGVEKKPLPYLLCLTNMLIHDVDDPQIINGNSLEKNVRDYTDEDKFDLILMNPPFGGKEEEIIKNNFPQNLSSSETADLFMILIMYRLKENGKAAVILPDGFLFGGDVNQIEIKKKLMTDFNLHTIIRLPKSCFAPYTPTATNILFFDNNGSTKETWYYRLDMPEGLKNFSKTKPIKSEHTQPIKDWWKNKIEIIIEEQPKAKKYTFKDLEDNNFNLDVCGYQAKTEEIPNPYDLIEDFLKKRAEYNNEIESTLNKILEILNEDI